MQKCLDETFNKANNLGTPQLLNKGDSILLFLSVILREINPIFTFICFLIIILTSFSKKIHFPKYIFWIIICFIIFYTNTRVTGLVTYNNVIWYSIPSIMAIFIGYNYAYKYRNDFSMCILLYTISFSLAFPNIIITIYDIFNTGLINPERSLTSITGEGEERAVTGRTIELTLAISGISMIYFIRYLKHRSKYIKLYVVTSIVAEICTLHYVSRTGIAIFLISIIIGYLYTYRGRHNFRDILILCILAIICLCYLKNSAIYEVFADREIEGSNIYDAGGRSARWGYGLFSLLENPIGYQSYDWYVHNFWLDFGREGGLIPSLLLMLFSIFILIICTCLQSFRKIPKYIRFNILIFIYIINIAFFTEPVHSGSTISMYFYFMLSGIVLGLYRQRDLCR